MKAPGLTLMAAGWVTLCIALGGSTAGGALANMLLQIFALGILGWAAVASDRAGGPGRLLLILAGTAIVLIGFSVVPLPPALWSILPLRGTIVRGFEMVGIPLPWLPLSLSPQGTLSSALGLLPAIAMLALILRLKLFDERSVARSIALISVVAVVVGALQRVGGAGSPAYFYAISSFGSAVGPFANANHFAALLVVTIPFLATIEAEPIEGRAQQQALFARRVLLAGIVALIVFGIVLSGSLAIVGLLPPVLFGSALIAYRKGARARLALFGTIGIVAAGALALAFLPLETLVSSDADVSQGTRLEFWSHTLGLIAQSFPVGTGLGTFQRLYPSTEDAAAITGTFVNHAHNDYLEIILEFGIGGLLLIIAFLLWWARRVVILWTEATTTPVELAATIASGALLLHSLVDYPLRTAGLSTLFALCCAIMTGVAPRVVQRRRSKGSSSRRHVVAG